ncbi:MAG TPA: xylulokinase [Dermatophilaceae bacterium]|nr:xylulokinase [Dermatophilaceae bacterium]
MVANSSTLVAGVDSSTQSTKVLVCDADTGEVVREGRAGHPEGTSVHPDHWWAALATATAGGLLDGVSALAVGGQQHGMVLLDEHGQVVRDALLWNDTRSAGSASDLVAELGGPAAWAEAVGSVPLAAFTVSKLRWVAEHEPHHAARATSVLLPHDWLTWRLRGPDAGPTTDRGDASGTGYWSAPEGRYREDLLVRAFGRSLQTPEVLGPADPAGHTAVPGSGIPPGLVVAPGTGDNMGAALGLNLQPGDVVVSLGTSGTAFAVHHAATADAAGDVAGFADATGRFLPLVCTLNAARVLTATAGMLGIGLPELDAAALSAEPGARGMVLLPYLDGERTPNLPTATGTLTGLTRDAMTPANLARAAVEGMLCALADGVDALRTQGVPLRRVLLIGGAARSAAVQRVAPIVFGVPVLVPEPAEYVALGAARQAAWTLAATRDGGAAGAAPPDWRVAGADEIEPPADAAVGQSVRAAYAAARRRMHG